MGYIYKITNTLNNKIYIGQTVKSVQKRFTQHKNNSNKEYFSQIVLYKAFNKYGIENFICEEIEEVPNEKLDEREKYCWNGMASMRPCDGILVLWNEYYDSYFDGYNSTLGGRATQLYNWDVEDIIERYLNLKSARAVAKEIGCDHSTIDRILNESGVKRFTVSQQQSKPLYFKKGEELHRFETTRDAAMWLIDNKITKMTNPNSVRQEITNRILNNKKYFGFEVYYESKI